MVRRSVSRHFAGDLPVNAAESSPFPFLNPTRRTVPVRRQPRPTADPKPPPADIQAADATQAWARYTWRSRDNRKGRHGIQLRSGAPTSRGGVVDGGVPRATNEPAEIGRGLLRMVARFPVWDVSYDVAVVFTLGSIIWVFNGFFVWLPLVAPQTEFEGEVSSGGGITALVGATAFEFGSVLLMLEAVNEHTSACFGWALEESIEGEETRLHLCRPRSGTKEADCDPPVGCRHHHASRRFWITRPGGQLGSGVEAHPASGDRRWTWWPSWSELKNHYFYELGFLACSAQMVGATIFWISGFTALGQIQETLSTPALNGVYWLPQVFRCHKVVGGAGFIVSSCLFMLETQKRWYIPAPGVLGWHIGLWNLIGSLGFTICGGLGFAAIWSDSVEFAASLATFIGSWAFLVGSLIQWYESLSKYPVTYSK